MFTMYLLFSKHKEQLFDTVIYRRVKECAMSEQEARKLISGLTREEKLALRELLIQLRANRKKIDGAGVVVTAEILRCAQNDKSLGAAG